MSCQASIQSVTPDCHCGLPLSVHPVVKVCEQAKVSAVGAAESADWARGAGSPSWLLQQCAGCHEPTQVGPGHMAMVQGVWAGPQARTWGCPGAADPQTEGSCREDWQNMVVDAWRQPNSSTLCQLCQRPLCCL